MPSDDAAPRPRLELLGMPTLVDGLGQRIALERKAAALLALLALDGARSRAALAALLWPDRPLSQARNSLRQRLFRLQRAAAADVVVGHEELRLADGLVHDIAGIGERLADDPQAPVAGLLEGLVYDDTAELAAWVEAARTRCRRQRSDCVAELASRHEARQQVVLSLQYAERLLADEPLLEHAHRRVMRLHYLRGDRAAALAAYEHCKALLRDELAATPDHETTALAQTIASPGATVPARALAPTVSVMRPPRMVGREAARARLLQLVAARGVLLLHGEPGIGKSRLFEELVQGQPALLASGGQAGDAHVPYALLARLAGLAAQRTRAALPGWVTTELARLVPAWGAPPSARLDPLRLQQAFEAALAAWSDGGIAAVLVDDLHHADEATLECLLGLAASPARRVAWLFGVRSQEMPALLQQWLAAAEPHAVDTLRLGPLDGPQLAQLLSSLQLAQFDTAGWSDALARHSGGNPLFALETVRALLALGDAAPAPHAARLPVPAALDALIERRLARLSDAALKLARVAALAGADFDAEVAAAVLQMHPLDMVEPWRELEAAELISGNRYTHDLIAETVLRALPQGIAASLHARLAGSLEALGRQAARVAPHWAGAQAWARAGDAYATAAREARLASRRNDEMLLWEGAADCYDRAGQQGKAFEARADSVECLILVRGVAEAAARVDRLDHDQQTEAQRMRALTARACVCLMGGRAQEGEDAARSALQLATRLGAPWPRFEAARLLAVALSQAGRAGEALQVIEPFREMVTAQGNAEQRHHFWSDYAYALKAAQRASDTAQALRHAMASAQEAGDHAELATLTSNLALVEGNLGRAAQALEHARHARALNDPLGVAVGPPAGAIELYVSMHEGALGRYTEALAGFERARRCFAGAPGTVWVGLSCNHLAHVLIHLGQFARAHQTLQWSGTTTPATEARRTMLQARIDRALAHRGEHTVDAALAQLDGRDPLMLMLLQLEATLAMPPAEAAAACAQVVADAERTEHLAVAMRGRLLRLRHHTQAAMLHADEADDVVARLRRCHPADTYYAEAWWIVARAFDALARAADAEAALREGFDWVSTQALPQVPLEFRDSFLHRNPVNRELLAAASHRIGLQVAPAPMPR